MPPELIDAHELLISEHEMLERDYDRLKLAKRRERERLLKETNEVRRQLRMALAEIDELQALLAKAFVRA